MSANIKFIYTSFRNVKTGESLARCYFLFQCEYKKHFIFADNVRILFFYFNVMNAVVQFWLNFVLGVYNAARADNASLYIRQWVPGDCIRLVDA